MTSALEGAGSLVIRRETPSEYEAVEYLTREAFWNVYRPGCNEHYVLHTFRDNPDFVPELDLVLERDGRLIGHIMYDRATIQADDGRTIPVMTFGPISIHPDVQRRGYGRYLMDRSMERARALNLVPEPVMFRRVFCYTEKGGTKQVHNVLRVPVKMAE